MKIFTHHAVISRIFIIIALLFSATNYVQADGSGPNDGNRQSAKAFYDINVTKPETMAAFLGVIDGTYTELVNNGAKRKDIRFVVSLRGASVIFVTENYAAIDPVNGEAIREVVNSLLEKKVRVEVCIISCRWFGVDPADPNIDYFDGVKIIDNAFISSIQFQTRGYALIPISEIVPYDGPTEF